ncbi:Coenzyme F420-reducing hydrogenase, gamma subunit [Methanocaldococcus lauensis]|uniref:Coenzyme F420-reducing hydrogenase, gamma subunit n=1 Tax=Methanocaldococcus lauensis TaxID=2546128 RepID=A0A8D6PWZ9_9EURY|nr:4Fe-4S binding protein [Methanocaldococcus lauensis]CAB3287491.1 Coenzyme F420-reducing hydrogenase, gamma subunit [Methanocaldococcus lauensis]
MVGCGYCGKIIKSIEKKYYDKLKEKKIALVGGAVNLDDKEEVEKIKEIRKNSDILIAVGSCAVSGGFQRMLIGLENGFPQRFVRIGDVVKVDYAIIGCPPDEEEVEKVVEAVLNKDKEIVDSYLILKPYEIIAGKPIIDAYMKVNEVLLTSNKELCLGCDDAPINYEFCTGCGTCVAKCPANALTIDEKPKVNISKCIKCGTCFFNCIRVKEALPSEAR